MKLEDKRLDLKDSDTEYVMTMTSPNNNECLQDMNSNLCDMNILNSMQVTENTETGNINVDTQNNTETGNISVDTQNNTETGNNSVDTQNNTETGNDSVDTQNNTETGNISVDTQNNTETADTAITNYKMNITDKQNNTEASDTKHTVTDCKLETSSSDVCLTRSCGSNFDEPVVIEMTQPLLSRNHMTDNRSSKVEENPEWNRRGMSKKDLEEVSIMSLVLYRCDTWSVTLRETQL
jgi:hypothetical protein